LIKGAAELAEKIVGLCDNVWVAGQIAGISAVAATGAKLLEERGERKRTTLSFRFA